MRGRTVTFDVEAPGSPTDRVSYTYLLTKCYSKNRWEKSRTRTTYRIHYGLCPLVRMTRRPCSASGLRP